MSYDYVLDTFGEYRNHRTRYSDLEDHVIHLMRDFLCSRMTEKTFSDAFDDCRKEYINLEKKDEQGRTVIDQDTPLWLNSFLFKWMQWYRVWRTLEEAKNFPHITSSSEWSEMLDVLESRTRDLKRAIVYCLENYHSAPKEEIPD